MRKHNWASIQKIVLTQIKCHFPHRVNMAPWHARTAEKKTHAWLSGRGCHSFFFKLYTFCKNIIKIKVFIKNVVAVAAYSRLASWSQAYFQTMKLSPLSTPLRIRSWAEHCIHLSFTSIFASLVYECESDMHCPSGLSQAFFESRNEVGWWLLTSFVSQSQEWAFFHVTFDIKRLVFRLVWKVVRCLSIKQDCGTTWPVFDGHRTPDRTARHYRTGRLRSVKGPAGWGLGREAHLKFPTQRTMTGQLGGWRVSRGND